MVEQNLNRRIELHSKAQLPAAVGLFPRRISPASEPVHRTVHEEQRSYPFGSGCAALLAARLLLSLRFVRWHSRLFATEAIAFRMTTTSENKGERLTVQDESIVPLHAPLPLWCVDGFRLANRATSFLLFASSSGRMNRPRPTCAFLFQLVIRVRRFFYSER